MTLNLSGMNLTIFWSNFVRFTFDSQRIFMVNEGKRMNKTKKIELPQVPDEKLQSSSESFQLNTQKFYIKWRKSATKSYEWDWNYLQSSEWDVYRKEQALYTGTNQPFNANTRTDADCTVRSWTQTVQFNRERLRESPDVTDEKKTNSAGQL